MIFYINKRYLTVHVMSTISSWKDWAKKSFPNKNAQKILEEMLMSEDCKKPEYPQEVFELPCRDNTIKPVYMNMISFSVGMKGVILSSFK